MLKRTCMRDHIRDALATRILDGTYPTGMQLKELALASEFDVSQAPVREALRELESSGLVTSERFRGTRVRSVAMDEMRESYELRAVLELHALRSAAPYQPALLTKLQQCFVEMDKAVKAEEPEGYVDATLRFHRHLVECCGNRALLTMWDSLIWNVRGRIAVQLLSRTGRSLRPFVNLHRAILTRLRAQDTEGAAEQMALLFKRVALSFKNR